jgi:hypothetical protein
LHDLDPLHTPLRSHEAAPSSGHSRSGSAPSGIAEQVPTLPVRLHFSHVPEHRVLQHTPSAQKPVAHSEPREQVCPSDFLQTPETQV